MRESFANEQLSAYLDGELTDVEAADLERRIAQDPALRAELEELRGATEFLRTHGPAQAPGGLYGAVLAKVENEPVPGAWWRWLVRPFGIPIQGIAVAAVAVIVFVLALDLGRDAFDAAENKAVAPDDASAAPDAPAVSAAPPEEPIPDAVAQLDTGVPQYKQKTMPPAPMKTAEPKPKSAATEWDPDQQAIAEPKQDPMLDDAVADVDLGLIGTKGDSSDNTSTSSSTRRTRGGSAKEQAATQSAEKPMMHNTTVAYRLETEDPGVLFKLNKIAGKYGGRVEAGSGGSITPYDLDHGSTQSIVIRVPSKRITQFYGELRRLGMLTEIGSAQSTELLSADYSAVQVTVVVSGPEQMEAEEAYDAYEVQSPKSRKSAY